jgi:hypothetical protein
MDQDYRSDLSYLPGFPEEYRLPHAEAAAQVADIPQSEMPDAHAREDLIAALMDGEAERVYQPVAGDHFNVAMTVPDWVDCRLPLREWLALRCAGQTHAQIRKTMIARAKAQTEANIHPSVETQR